MKKFFSSKTDNSKSKGKQKTKQDDVSLNELLFKKNEIYNSLEIWSEMTNWKISDFSTILGLTKKCAFPVTICEHKKAESKLYCQDANNNLFCISLSYIFTSSSSVLTLEFEDETFKYILNNKIYDSDVPQLILTSHKKICEDKTYIYQFDNLSTKIQFQAIFGEYVHKIDIKLLEHSKKCILDNIAGCYDFEKIFIFNDDCTCDSFIKNLVENAQLSIGDLTNLRITTESFVNDTVFEKIDLLKNVVVEVVVFSEFGYVNIFDTGKFILYSEDRNISITINDIFQFTKTPPAIMNLEEIIEELKEAFPL